MSSSVARCIFNSDTCQHWYPSSRKRRAASAGIPDREGAEGDESPKQSRGGRVPDLISEVRSGKFEGLTDVVVLQIRVIPKELLAVRISRNGRNNTADS